MKTILTGIKPTGEVHIGNYFGAIKPILEKEGNIFVFIPDIHALNSISDTKLISENCYKMAAALIALGLNPEKTIFFRQSAVRQHAELSTLLMNLINKSTLEGCHAYKALRDSNIKMYRNKDSGINMGLMTYPILMSADILLYNSDIIPVGKDQKQHIEFTREIAKTFNTRYKKIFKIPEYEISDTEIVGTDGRKMSKSYNNTIPIFCDEKELRKKVMRIVTDSKRPEEPKDPESVILFKIFCLFADSLEIELIKEKLLNGKISYSEMKEILFVLVRNNLSKFKEKYIETLNNREEIDRILSIGKNKAEVIAEKNMVKIRKSMGLSVS